MNYSNALDSLTPSAGWSWDGKTYEGITWHSHNTDNKPTKAELDAEVIKLQAEYDAKDWERNRQAEYPSLEDCIHALLDGGDTLTDLQALRAQVKSDNPKPS